jgi:general stress protein YciG
MTKQAQATISNAKGVGKGWHGDPQGHAKAGHKGGIKSSGNFRNDPKRAAAAGRMGGRISPGNFKNDPERARVAGRKGGSH